MLNRIIALSLIAAVFGCPLWCSMGLCKCSAETTALNGSAIKCCCGTEVDIDKPASGRTKSPAPAPESDSLRCQGVCGGAVLESRCRVPDAEVCQLLTCVGNSAYLSFSSENRLAFKTGIPEIFGTRYQGKSARIWLMSFQC